MRSRSGEAQGQAEGGGEGMRPREKREGRERGGAGRKGNREEGRGGRAEAGSRPGRRGERRGLQARASERGGGMQVPRQGHAKARCGDAEPRRGSWAVKQSGRANLGLMLRSASHRRAISMAAQPARRLFPRKSRMVSTSPSYSSIAWCMGERVDPEEPAWSSKTGEAGTADPGLAGGTREHRRARWLGLPQRQQRSVGGGPSATGQSRATWEASRQSQQPCPGRTPRFWGHPATTWSGAPQSQQRT